MSATTLPEDEGVTLERLDELADCLVEAAAADDTVITRSACSVEDGDATCYGMAETGVTVSNGIVGIVHSANVDAQRVRRPGDDRDHHDYEYHAALDWQPRRGPGVRSSPRTGQPGRGLDSDVRRRRRHRREVAEHRECRPCSGRRSLMRLRPRDRVRWSGKRRADTQCLQVQLAMDVPAGYASSEALLLVKSARHSSGSADRRLLVGERFPRVPSTWCSSCCLLAASLVPHSGSARGATTSASPTCLHRAADRAVPTDHVRLRPAVNAPHPAPARSPLAPSRRRQRGRARRAPSVRFLACIAPRKAVRAHSNRGRRRLGHRDVVQHVAVG